MTNANTHQVPIRRLPDGSIDLRHYEARAHALRAERMGRPVIGLLGRITRRIFAAAAHLPMRIGAGPSRRRATRHWRDRRGCPASPSHPTARPASAP